MTTPEQQPVLHYWYTHYEEARRLSEGQMLAQMLSYSRVMARALELVIANHIESRAPIVLEGDFILPSLAVQPSYNGVAADGQVRAVFLYEEDEGQIGRNYLAREGEEQPGRARVSWRHSEWLRREAERLGVPTLPARPWETVLERVIAALEEQDESSQ
jgi:2-phosphoglycerate kinase